MLLPHIMKAGAFLCRVYMISPASSHSPTTFLFIGDSKICHQFECECECLSLTGKAGKKKCMEGEIKWGGMVVQ